MANDFQKRLDSVTETVLTPLVRSAVKDENIEMCDWTIQTLKAGGGQFYGVEGMARVSGHACNLETGEKVPWSMILKAFSAPEHDDADIASNTYWKREALVYKSGMLDDLPAAMSAPRCHGVTEYPGEVYWVWMEDLGNIMQEPWPLSQYGTAARCLGQFNGAYLMGKPIPHLPWLSRGRTRYMLDLAAPVIQELERRSREPVLSRWLGDGGPARVQRLWSERERLLAGLDTLPRTLCHHDAFCRNLVLRQGKGDDEVLVGIDWAMVGPAAVGQEIGPLVSASLYFLDVDMTDVQQLDRDVFEGYLAGLRDGGWRGDAQLVRFGYAASMALSAGIGTLAYLDFFVEDRGQVEAFFGHSRDQVLNQLALVHEFLLDRGEEAIGLLAVM